MVIRLNTRAELYEDLREGGWKRLYWYA